MNQNRGAEDIWRIHISFQRYAEFLHTDISSRFVPKSLISSDTIHNYSPVLLTLNFRGKVASVSTFN
jgi:hypothetical protein